MDRTWRRIRPILATVLVLLSLFAFAGSVSADPGPTPNGLTGACNMLRAWDADPRNGMDHAMAVNNPNGNIGMARAVARSGSGC
jgi:hypothetical protein